MKISSPYRRKKARIEIIPLIDIMFFLLAAFMLASLTMIRLQSIKMNLPTATQGARESRPNIVNIAVDKAGNIYVENKMVTDADLRAYLADKLRSNTNYSVYISGDKDATHGSVIRVLDLVRREGIEKVSFAITAPERGH